MQVEVKIRTYLEFEDIEDINDAYEIICNEMLPCEILELADNQGSAINVDVEA